MTNDEHYRLEQLWLQYPNTFRMDQGTAWVGGKEYLNADRERVVKGARKMSYGIDGAGDRIGWSEVVVTPEMVGHKVAIFTSIEDKSIKDSIGYNQLIFMLNVLLSGGIAKVYRDLKELTTEQTLALPRRKPKDKSQEKILERRVAEWKERSVFVRQKKKNVVVF